MSKGPKNPEKSFGVSVGGVLIVIALALWWRGRIGRAEVLGGIGGVLLFFGVVQPRLLKWPSAAWWKFSRVLGYVNARILLTLMFSLLLVPVSLLWRAHRQGPAGAPPRQVRRDGRPIRRGIGIAAISNACSEVIMKQKSRHVRVLSSSCARKRSTGWCRSSSCSCCSVC